MRKISSYIFTILVLLPLLCSCFLFVQNASAKAIELNNEYPVFPGGIDIKTKEGQQLNSIIAWLYYAIIGISGFIAFLMIVFGGVQYLTSAGNASAISEAKDRIKSALLGLLIIFASYIILNTVNPNLLRLTITNLSPAVGVKGGGGTIIPEGTFTVNGQKKIFTILPGETKYITLAWDGKGADWCEAKSYCEKCTGENETIENPKWTGKLKSVKGSESFSLEKTTKLFFICYHGNSTYVEDAIVTVSSCTSDCPAPKVDLKIKTINGLSDGPINSSKSEIPNYILEFYWTSTSTDKCSGRGPGSFTFPSSINTSGNFSSLATYEYVGWQNFTITCQNDNGSTIDTVKINFDYP